MIWILAALIQTAVPPEHVEIYARLDTISSYPTNAAYCGNLGFTVSEDFTTTLAERAFKETDAQGVTRETSGAWLLEGGRRALKTFEDEMAAYGSQLGDENEIATTVRAMYSSLQSKCAKVASDPISVGIFTAGTPEELQAAKTNMEDQLLADVGAASWQTPAIWARGELLEGLGVCKNNQSREEHDRLIAAHLPPSTDTTSAGRWLSAQYVEGIRGSADMGLDATQCRRLVSGRVAALNAATR